MRVAFLLYPTDRVKVNEDTSFWIMLELARRGHTVSHFESADLFYEKGSVRAFLTPSRLDARKGFLPSPRASHASDLAGLDCVFVRKEPPFDTEYLYALELLDLIKRRVFVVNDPSGIATANEKLFILNFPKHIPETLVTEDVGLARIFIKSLRGPVVVKPLDNKGGAGVFSTHARDRNAASLLDMATHNGARKVMLQRALPADRLGDKRILILDGEILGAFLRRPSSRDFRANLGVGGSLHRARVTPRDEGLVSEMRGELSARGLWFVGLDLIGEFLTEVNVTSPSGIADLRLLEKKPLERKVADFLESRVSGGKARR